MDRHRVRVLKIRVGALKVRVRDRHRVRGQGYRDRHRVRGWG